MPGPHRSGAAEGGVMSHPVVEWAGRVITILLLLAGSGLQPA